MCEQAAAKLNEYMAKLGITPHYDLVDSDTGTHQNTFVMRVQCRTVPNGPIYTAEGLGRSKKAAKHEAALNFMQKYLGDNNNNPSLLARKLNPLYTCAVNVTENNRNSLLQSLCSRYKLPRPEFCELDCTGPPHAKHFTFQCSVSHFSTNGKGTTKSEAKLQATTRMIQLLMQEVQVLEIFESPLSTVANGGEIICLSDHLKVPQLPVSIGIFGRRRSSSTVSDIFPNCSDTSSVVLSRTRRTIDPPSLVVGIMNSPERTESIAEGSDDSASNMSLIDLEDELQQKAGLNKNKSKSMTDLLDCGNGKTSSKTLKNLSRAQAIGYIDATLEKVEKLLYKEILDSLENRESPCRKTVVVLYHEFEVCINHGSLPKILEGGQQCTDPSIRIAALTKLLMDMKNHAALCGRNKLNL